MGFVRVFRSPQCLGAGGGMSGEFLEEGFDDEIGLAVALVGGESHNQQTMFGKTGIAPLI